jgi:hypothetical protein
MLVVAVLVIGGLGGGYAVWSRGQGVHAGDTYRVTLTRHGCQEADPLHLHGWSWVGGLPRQYGDGPVAGRLRVDSTERRTATFTADAGWSTPFSGHPNGFSDLNCSVYG